MQETQETQVRFLGQEDPLEKAVATHSSILAWRIPWTDKPGGLQSVGSQSNRTEQLNNNNKVRYILVLYFLVHITFYNLLVCWNCSELKEKVKETPAHA